MILMFIALVCQIKSWAVDVPKDVKIVERIIKNAKKNI